MEINVSHRVGGQDEDLGDHQFAVVPRVGEQVTLSVGGELRTGVVEQIFHGSRPVSGRGPDGDPGVMMRVALNRL